MGRRRRHREAKKKGADKADLIATMDAAVAEVEEHRMRFDELSVSSSRLCSYTPRYVQSTIAEEFVRQWLVRVSSLAEQRTPYSNGGNYELRKSPSGGFVVYHGNKRVGEFDGAYCFDSTPVIVEVKSNFLETRATLGDYHRVLLQIDTHLDLARNVYGRDDVGLLLFYPFASNPLADRNFVPQLRERLPSIRCIDSGYSSRALDAVVRSITGGKTTKKKSHRYHKKRT